MTTESPLAGNESPEAEEPTAPGLKGMVVRAPKAGEEPRVLHLFRQCALPSQTQILLAVKKRPVERLVGGIAGWTEGEFGRIRLAWLPGLAPQTIAGPLIERAAETAHTAGLTRLLYADALTDKDPQCALLRANGFEIMRSERYFLVAAVDAAQRVAELLQRYADRTPKQWHADPIRQHRPEAVLDLMAPFRLLSPDEVRRLWEPNTQGGFDLDLSVILFAGDTPIGTLLTRRKGETLCYDVRVVQHENPRLRALANLCLFKANADQNDPANPIRWLEFRGGETEHRETANLAFRMGGKELPPRHVWARTL